MRVKELRISGFRAIPVCAHVEEAGKPAGGTKGAQKIVWDEDAFTAELPVQSGKAGHMMTAVMGPNSAGKSSILLAMNLLFSTVAKLDPGFFHGQDTDAPVIVEADLCGQKTLLEAGSGAVNINSAWMERFCRQTARGVEMTVASVWSRDGRQRFLRAADGHYYKQTAADRAICERLLPAFRMIWADTRPGEAAELKRDNLLSDLVAHIFRPRDEERGEGVAGQLQALLAALERLLARDSADAQVDWSALEALEVQLSDGLAQLTPQQSRVRIRLDAALPRLEDLLSRGVTVIDDGAALPFEQHGLGVQRAFALAVLKAWCARLVDDTQDYVFAIEEPEIYLHPHAARVMLRILAQIAQRHQVLFTTHSGEFVNRAPLQHVLMVSRRWHKDKLVSRVQRPRLRGLKADDIMKVQRYLCEDRSDMLFARSVLLVEGQAELFALPAFARTLGIDLDAEGISVVFVNGIGNFGVYHQILCGFGIPHTILMDGDGKRAERLRFYTGMADALVVLAHDFERQLVDALTPERRRLLGRECLQRRGKPGKDITAGGARGAQDLANLGKPLVGRVAGELCTAQEIRQMPAIVEALESTLQLANVLPELPGKCAARDYRAVNYGGM